jgi:arsenite methyltransferase
MIIRKYSSGRPSIERLIENEDLGIEILHPGGLALTVEFARLCGVREDAQVLEVASGTGETSCLLTSEFGAHVTCLDLSSLMLLRARSKARRRALQVGWVRGDAHALPFADSLFDAVLSECTLCYLDKPRALREMVRVARPGAAVGIHDLCWRPGTPEKLKQRLRELEDEEPETRDGWQALFEGAGLIAIEVQDRSDLIPDWIRGTRSQLGVLGYVRIAATVLQTWGLHGLRSVLASERIFASPHLGYAIIIGRKPGPEPKSI